MQHTQADDNDLLDLVDKGDKVIGTIQQADARSLLETKAGYIRGTIAFIQNDEGKFWTPLRTANKRIAPNGLDFGVAEHVQSGETYEHGLIRGFKEELFLDVKANELRYLGKLEPTAHPHLPYFFTSVFLYHANEIKNYNKADFVSYEWLTAQEIIDWVDSGKPCKAALKPALVEFLL